MRQIHPFVDERLAGFCFSCNTEPTTRDHVPPKVFLDEPYPENLAVVGACRSCNEEASVDEEYVACLLEVAACGSAGKLDRPKIPRILEERPALASRLREALTSDGHLAVEHERVRRVVAKLARGLWRYEVGEPTGMLITEVGLDLLATFGQERFDAFLTMSTPALLPEVGSRLMIKAIESLGEGSGLDPWQVVQPRRFAYAVDVGDEAGPSVKMIIRDTLAAEVRLATPG